MIIILKEKNEYSFLRLPYKFWGVSSIKHNYGRGVTTIYICTHVHISSGDPFKYIYSGTPFIGSPKCHKNLVELTEWPYQRIL